MQKIDAPYLFYTSCNFYGESRILMKYGPTQCKILTDFSKGETDNKESPGSKMMIFRAETCLQNKIACWTYHVSPIIRKICMLSLGTLPKNNLDLLNI